MEQSENKVLYHEICARHTDVPVFLQPWWLDAVGANWDVAIVQKGDHCAGVWPYHTVQRLGVHMLRTPLLTSYLGPHVFYPADMKAANRDSFEHDTIEALLQQIPRVPVWHVNLPPAMKQAGLFAAHGLDMQVKQTFLVDLEQGEDKLFADLKDSIRRNIKAAARDIDITNDASCLPQLYEFQKETLARKKIAQPYTLTVLQRLMDACLAHDAGALWVARKGDDIQAIVWHIWDATTAYYFMGAQNAESGAYTAMSALLWHAIVTAAKRGNQVFDLEGSMDPGVEKFFRGFGGRRELYLILKRNTSPTWRLVNALRK